MQYSIHSAATLARSLSAGKTMMLKKLSIFALVLSACGASLTQADATFSYELSGPDDNKTVKQFSIARFFVRVDDPAKEKQFLLFTTKRRDLKIGSLYQLLKGKQLHDVRGKKSLII